MTSARHLVLVALILVGWAFGPVMPAAARAGPELAVTVTRDIPYVANAGPRQTLDLYLPETTSSAAYPLVVWIHGGGWRRGDKEAVRVEYLLREGYAVASLAYRLSGDAIFPAQIQDVNAALGFLWDQAGPYHLDPDRFVVGGTSAGGHLATLAGLSANDRPATFETDPDVRIAAILDFFGPTDLTAAGIVEEEPEALVELLGGTVDEKPDLARVASPVSWIDAADPPVLTIHGESDRIVPVSQSQLLDAALEDAGIEHTLIVIPDAPHGGPQFQTDEIHAAVIAFLAGAMPAG